MVEKKLAGRGPPMERDPIRNVPGQLEDRSVDDNKTTPENLPRSSGVRIGRRH